MAKMIEVRITKCYSIDAEAMKELWSGHPEVLQKYLDLFEKVSGFSDLYPLPIDPTTTQDAQQLRKYLVEAATSRDEDEEILDFSVVE